MMMTGHLEPAELSGMNAKNPAILATMYTLNKHLNTIIDESDVLLCREKLLAEAAKLQDEFGKMLVNINTPNEHFPYIACGAFKECYSSWLTGWVVKFVSVENETGAERQLLAAAADYGILPLFLPSHYIDLPVWVESSHLDSDSISGEEYDGDPEEYESQSMDTAILQPECTTVGDAGYAILHSGCADFYDKFPVMLDCGKPLEFNMVQGLDIPSLDWLQAVVETHGDAMLFRFLQFVKDFNLTDLHENNLGYYTDRFGHEQPILLDWLSGDPELR